jgi:hypothetical protein
MASVVQGDLEIFPIVIIGLFTAKTVYVIIYLSIFIGLCAHWLIIWSYFIVDVLVVR